MDRLIGWVDVLFGGLFVVLGGIAIAHAPAAWRNFGAEPEDFYASLLFFVVLVALGGFALIAGTLLIRVEGFRKISFWTASTLSAISAALLALLGAFGTWIDEVGVGELRLLLIPAGLLAISSVRLRRRRAIQHEVT